MEARFCCAALVAAALLSLGASYRTQNFITTAATPQLAREICEKAESDRQRLAVEWLGAELPPWQQPCPITVHVGNIGAGGATSFMFDNGRPFGWTMTIQGTRERILDSVLPHEVTHTIFATHFGRPLPRWADEGACTTVEHESERQKQERMLISFLTTNRGIAFNHMFAMTEYPHDVLPLYAQGYSLARFLIAHGGKQKYVRYVGDGMRWNNWPAATKRHYGFGDLSELQVTWLDWVRRGSPPIRDPAAVAQLELLADQEPTKLAEAQLAMAENVLQPSPEPVVEHANQGMVPLVPVKAAPARQVSQVTEIRSWYLQQRDLALAARVAADGTMVQPPSPVQTTTGSYAPGSIKNGVTPPATLLSRPQPIGRPQQTVLEWSNVSAATSGLEAHDAGQEATQSPAALYDAAVERGTLLR